MAIDWANEPFVRLYKRETDEDLLLSWEARAVWHEVLKHCDQSGRLDTRRGVRGLAALIKVPVEVVERSLPELIEDGRIRSVPETGIIVPNYVEANFTPSSDNARQAESRLRRRHVALTASNRGVTPNDYSLAVTGCHTESHADTHNITDTDQNSAIPPESPRLDLLKAKCDLLELPLDSEGEPEAAAEAKPRRKGRIPADWKPRQQERDLAAQLGLNVDDEAAEFLDFWLGDGRPKLDWDRTFAVRLRAQSKKRPPWQGGRPLASRAIPPPMARIPNQTVRLSDGTEVKVES